MIFLESFPYYEVRNSYQHKHNQLRVSIWIADDDLWSQDMIIIYCHKSKSLVYKRHFMRKRYLSAVLNRSFCDSEQILIEIYPRTNTVPIFRRGLYYKATNNTELALLLRHKNDVKYGFMYTRLRWRKVCEQNRSKFSLFDLLQCLERPASLSDKPALFLSFLYYEISGKFPTMPYVCWWIDRRDFDCTE